MRTSRRFQSVFGLGIALAVAACSGGGDDDATPLATPAETTPDRTTDSATDTPEALAERSSSEVTDSTVESSAPSEPADSAAAALAAPADAVMASEQPAARCGAFEEPGEPTELTVWHTLGGDAVGLVDQMVLDFQAEHPWISVTVAQPDGYPSGIPLLKDLPDEERPDVILANELTVRLQVDSGHFVPIDECGGGSRPDQFTDLLPVIETTFSVDGTLWAAPFSVSTPVLLYDGKVWRDAGLDPDQPPTTFEELETAIRAVRDSGVVSHGIAMYDRSGMWIITQTASKSERELAEPANGYDGIAIDSVDLADDATLDVLQRFQQMYNEGYINWLGVNATGQADLNALVLPPDRSGMTLHTSASLGDIYRYQERGQLPDLEIRAGPMPGPDAGATVGGGAWWILDKGDVARTESAWLLVDWLTQPERVAELAAFTGYVPTTERAAADPAMTEAWERWPALRTGYEQVAAADGSPADAGLQVGPGVDVHREIELLAAWIIDGNQDPAEQLATNNANVSNMLEIYADTVAEQ